MPLNAGDIALLLRCLPGPDAASQYGPGVKRVRKILETAQKGFVP